MLLSPITTISSSNVIILDPKSLAEERKIKDLQMLTVFRKGN
jgi:hypothetical protein